MKRTALALTALALWHLGGLSTVLACIALIAMLTGCQ
jgi:hypothetical protein